MYAYFVGYFPQAVAFLAQGYYFFVEMAFIAGFGAADMVALRGESLEFVAQKIKVVFEADEGNVVFAVFFLVIALFYLLEVTHTGLAVALANGEGAVGKINEHFAALQVVHCEWFVRVALGCVRQHQYRQLVFGFECFEHFHKRHGVFYVAGAAAHVGNVIDNERLRPGFLHGRFNFPVHEIVIFRVTGHPGSGGRVELAAVKIFRKQVAAPLRAIIAGAELRAAELKIEIKHACRCAEVVVKRRGAAYFGEAIGNLYSEDGFAEVGIGKEDTELVLRPQTAEELFSRGLAVLL